MLLEQIKNITEKFNITNCRNFIETGTFLGVTISEMSKIFETLYTIEISEKLYNYNVDKWEELKNINFILGDSSEKLEEVISKITGECIFFLDGHYSGDNATRDNILEEETLKNYAYKTRSDEKIWKKNRVVIPTMKGKKDVPLYEELSIIDSHFKERCLVIIDDVRLFGQKFHHGDWKEISIDKIKRQFKNKKIIKDSIMDDRFCMLLE